MTEAQKAAAREARAAAKLAAGSPPPAQAKKAAPVKVAKKARADRLRVPRAPGVKVTADPVVQAEPVADALEAEHQPETEPVAEASPGEAEGNLDGKYRTPLDYMIEVMNNPRADPGRRDRMAVAAAVYLHKKQGETGKKGLQQVAAKAAGAGKYAPSAPPRLVSSR